MRKINYIAFIFLFSVAQVNAAPKVGVKKLKEALMEQGLPRLDGKVVVGDTEVPALKFGEKGISLNYKIVDAIRKGLGCSATVFVRSGEEFVRVSTNLLSADGTRAIGTTLAKNAAFESVSKGKTYCGEVEILGGKYDTCYEPLKIADKVEGVYYFGCKK